MLTPKELSQLQKLSPDFESQLLPKHEKQVALINRTHQEGGLSTRTKRHFTGLYSFLTNLDKIKEEGYLIDPNLSRSNASHGISIALNLSPEMVKDSLDNALKKAKDEHNTALDNARQEWLSNELKDLIKTTEENKMNEIKEEQHKIKNELLSKLFK